MNKEKEKQNRNSGVKWVIPFFLVMGILTVVSFLIPLRPTRSQMERRNLTRFPEFHWETLADGSYFDEITLWFSDTFPGREGWLQLSSQIESLHGHSEIAIAGDLDDWDAASQEVVLEGAAVNDAPAQNPAPAGESVPAPAETESVEAAEGTEETTWGGVDAGDDADIEITKGAVIQIGDAAFNAVGFSESYSKVYADALNHLVEGLEGTDVRVVSAPAPTAVGILIEEQNLEKLHCASQQKTIQFLHDNMDDRIVKVDTFGALVAHNDEYVYFRTDHHWTARGAYYAYAAICDALNYEAVPLEELEEWDQGEFEGSLYWRATYPRKLRKDTLYAYIPKGNLELRTRSFYGEGTVRPLIQDMTNREPNTKYCAFLFSDNPLVEVTNFDLPDGPKALVIKDSFGNALVPFLAQNYSKVYAIDYRKFHETTARYFAEVYDIDDVIFAPYVIATQAMDGSSMLKNLCN